MSQSRIIRRLREKAAMNNNKVPVFDFRVVNNYARLKDKATYLNADEDFNTRHLKENN